MKRQVLVCLELEKLGKALKLRDGLNVNACAYDFRCDAFLLKIDGDSSLPAVLPGTEPKFVDLDTLMVAREPYQGSSGTLADGVLVESIIRANRELLNELSIVGR